ncbi:Hypothetical protein SCF082_LOCUS37454 [Durusdinium trenchii]|uniref:Uncharacterized protein n=1 Tax=Durusdinium trenchii TaxID=1381693 RepID=A0ABP0PQH6_9DINO
MRGDEAQELWGAVRDSGVRRLGGREVCDFLHVLGACRTFQEHREVAEEVARSLLAAEEFVLELKLWPQTLPMVCQYLAWHLEDRRLLTEFLSQVLAPFWEQYPSAVQGSLLPHHAMAVASACARSYQLPLHILETVRDAICRWAQTNLSCLGPRGLASMALALSRLGPGLGGEEANARLLTQLLGRAQELLDESHGTKPFFRADWLGMFLSALARARCRTELKTLEELLKVHFKRQILAGEAQNLSLCAHAVLKLDLLQVAGIAPLELLAPEVKELRASMRGSSGARSLCLLAHAYGSALVLLPRRSTSHLAQVYDDLLQELLEISPKMKLNNIKVRFQMLTALQCWWLSRCFPSAGRSAGEQDPLPSAPDLASLRRVRHALECVADELPGPEESIGEQDLISTNDHAEVAQALSSLRIPEPQMENFAFPFWLDVVLHPRTANSKNGERQRKGESLSESGGQHTLALHVRMLDCLGSNLQVEILHCRFENAKGQSCCLVGIREFQDVGHAALAPLPFELSDVDGRTGVLLFDAESMEIIDVTNFERFTDQNLQGTSLQQLQAGPGGSLDEILLAIQDAVNDAYEKGKEKVGPIDLEELELFSTHLRGTLTLQHDLMLKTLVGTLSLEPKSKLTQQNVAKLEKFAQKKRESKRKRSRGSKGSQGSRSSGDSQLSGSILALRKKNCSL